jgi:hypothetical protein
MTEIAMPEVLEPQFPERTANWSPAEAYDGAAIRV